MQVCSVNQINFSGIKLSSNDVKKVRYVVNQLEEQGYSCLGKRTFICNNTVNDKVNLAKQIRSKANFFDNCFGAIFLPWSKEAYLMSNPIDEQLMYPLVREYDSGAVLNLSI